MSIRSALGAAIVVGVVLGPAGPSSAAQGDYEGSTTPPAAAVTDSDYAGIGQTYAGIVATAAATAPTYAGTGSDYVTGAQVAPLRSDEGGTPLGRARPAGATRFPVTSGDVAGLVGVGLVALGVAGSLRRRTP